MKFNHRVPGRTPGRLRRSQPEIDAILRGQQLSDLSLLVSAREHDLCYATLLRWGRRAADQGNVPTPARVATPTFIPIELEPAARMTGPPAGYHEGEIVDLELYCGEAKPLNLDPTL